MEMLAIDWQRTMVSGYAFRIIVTWLTDPAWASSWIVILRTLRYGENLPLHGS